MERAGQNQWVSKLWGFKIENCATSEVFKNKKYSEMYGCLHEINARPTQNSDTISVKFSVFKNFRPGSTIFIIKSTYELWHVLSISDTYKVLTLGFQLPQAAWERYIAFEVQSYRFVADEIQMQQNWRILTCHPRV